MKAYLNVNLPDVISFTPEERPVRQTELSQFTQLKMKLLSGPIIKMVNSCF